MHTTHRAPAFIVAGALAVLLAGVTLGAAAPQLERSDERGGVTIKATFRSAGYFKATPADPLAAKVNPEREIVFAIALDTHAGDLSQYDFVKKTTLRNDRRLQVAPLRWIATADGSHHRAGGLVFPRATGGRALDEQATALELVVRDLGGVSERVLRWTLPLE